MGGAPGQPSQHHGHVAFSSEFPLPAGAKPGLLAAAGPYGCFSCSHGHRILLAKGEADGTQMEARVAREGGQGLVRLGAPPSGLGALL